MFLRLCAAALAAAFPFAAQAALGCNDVLKALSKELADATCVVSSDLTTQNPQTTPADNSLPGLPPFAFTPTTDRSVISPTGGGTPINHAVPGLQIQARIAADPLGQARFLLRLPNNWNGRRSEEHTSELQSHVNLVC